MDREVLSVDVLFVGAGPANLCGALHLARSLRDAGENLEIAIIEKALSVGAHILSGAILDPRALDELMPDWNARGFPIEAKVTSESVHHLTARRALRIPVPPTLKNHGLYVVTLSEVVVWMKRQLEELGVMVFEGFPGDELLWQRGKVVGIRTVDKGMNADGTRGPNYEPGSDIEAQVVVLGEGSRGSLTKQLVDKLRIEGPNPQVYGTGCKEVWRLPAGRFAAGRVIHTAGWPARGDQYAGSWIYGMSGDRVSVGYVTALDGGDPWLDPWEMFQRWKTHPFVRGILAGGELIKCGAKTVPEGGYWSRPRMYGDGFLVVGDGASLLNISRLKGIHTAMKSGLLAAETILEAAQKNDYSAATLKSYEERFQKSWLKDELYRIRNFRQDFKSGFLTGAFKAGAKYLLGGAGKDRIHVHADHEEMRRKSEATARPPALQYDGKYLVDKRTQVFHAGAIHNEHQPSHLKVANLEVCATRCAEEYGNPCESFCPANVYEMVDDGGGGRRLQINHSNCVHCKTCDILDPYQIITWTVPSDAGGPKYQGL